MLRSAPPITPLSRLIAGEVAPKARVRGSFTGEEVTCPHVIYHP